MLGDAPADLTEVLERHARDRPQQVALIDGATGDSWTYGEVADLVGGPIDASGLAFLLIRENAHHVLAYLTLLKHAQAVALIHPETPPDRFEGLIASYDPEYIFGHPEDLESKGLEGQLWEPLPAEGDVHLYRRALPDDQPPLPTELQLLLSTSGSTGSPKFVRLSHANVMSNAEAIAESLALQQDDVAVTCLPLHYTYGLSILHSHLAAGASTVCTHADLFDDEFWRSFDRFRCTSLAGVPVSYSIYDRLGILDGPPTSLRYMTQAGGKLDPGSVLRYAEGLSSQDRDFYVMYGQTEATARMSVLPPELALEKPDTVGYAIPGGRFEIADGDGSEGEIIYHGPNVMLGYATCRNDLRLGDELDGVLRTGDVGHLTEEGLLKITGRLKRIVKVNGVRVSLDDVEALAREYTLAAAVGSDGKVRLYVEDQSLDGRELRRFVAGKSGMAVRDIEVVHVARLPIRGSGKIDYRSLESST